MTEDGQMPRFATVTTPTGLVLPLSIPNSVTDAGDFYISFNDCDISLYGDVTTALVFGQMEAFYVLNGDHRKAYAELQGKGFDACMAYFKSNIASINKRSDKPK